MTTISPARQTLKTIAIGTALLIVMAVSVIWIGQTNIQYARNNPGGTDFLVAWEGMRSVLQGENPYTDATALRIQLRAYGRPAAPGENQLRVPYPIYALLFLAPFYLATDFSVARGFWMTLVELSTIGFAFLSIRLSGKTWKQWQLTIFLLFSLAWYFGLRAIINGNVVILVSLFLALAVFCLKNKWDWAAGMILTFATMKPQVALFPIACFLIWTLFACRFHALIAFFTTLSLFVAVGLMISTSWIADDLREVLRYPSYNPPGNPESSLRAIYGVPGSWAGIAISVGAVALLIILWIRLPKTDMAGFLGILALTLVLSPLSGLQTDAGNEFILLLPVAFLLLPEREEGFDGRYRFAVLISILFLGLWSLFIVTLKRSDQPVQHPIMLFPLPIFLLLVAGADGIRNRTRRGTATGGRPGSGMDVAQRVEQ
jgi:hypothetical protein